MSGPLIGSSPAAMRMQPPLDAPDYDDWPTDEDGEPLSWEQVDAQNARDREDMLAAQEACYD